MLAAEQTGLRGYGIEIDPLYSRGRRVLASAMHQSAAVAENTRAKFEPPIDVMKTEQDIVMLIAA